MKNVFAELDKHNLQNENPTANESNGSGGSAVVKALRATEKRMVKSLAKKQENEL
ncbi:MAG: hypothetical protein J6T46_13945 [Victivallales bacterium]|nr:hypothetical protein [Victivallales bacterium]